MIIYLLIGVVSGTDLGERQSADVAFGAAHTVYRGHVAWMGAMNSIGSVGSAIAGQFIDRMGSHGGFHCGDGFGAYLIGDCLVRLQADQGSNEQPMLTTVSV